MKYDYTRIKLGQMVRDKITGFEGVVEHIYYQMYDAVKVGIQAPLDKDGKYGECYTLDEVGVETLKDKPVVEPVQATPKYNLGAKAKCTITGFEGTIVGCVLYLNGCVHYKVQPKIPIGKKAEDYAVQKFPEGCLEVEKPKKEYKPQKTGGPAMKLKGGLW